MKAVILVGGQGTRLRPLSCGIPKPMVPVLNRPLLDHILLNASKHGVTDFVLAVNHLPEVIKESFGDGSRSGVRINYVVEGNLEGLKSGDHVPVKFSRPESSSMRKVVPYSAVLYDARGNAWLYTSPEPLVFVRQPITVDFVEGERAVLKEGPAAGTPVVKTGAAELFGVEHKIGH